MDLRVALTHTQPMRPPNSRLLTYLMVLVCVCLMACTPIAAQAPDVTESSQRKAGLAGQVQRIFEETYDQEKPNTRMVIIWSYDKAGEANETIIGFLHKDAPERNTKQRAEVARDDSGRTKEKRMYGDDGTLISVQKYSYDDQGKLTQQVSYRSDGTEEAKWEYVYDQHGNEKEMKYYLKGLFKTRYLYAYDQHGNRIKTVAFRGEGSEEHTSIDKYDDKDHRTETVVYKPGGVVDRKHTYSI